MGRVEIRLIAAIEAEDGGPLAIAVVFHDDGAAEQGGDLVGGEVAGGGELAATAGVRVGEQVATEGRRREVGGEDDSRVVAVALRGGLEDLGAGEVVDGEGLDELGDVTELGAVEVGGDRPGCEHGGVRVVGGDVVDSLLVDDDHVAVREVVFRREGGGRVEPPGADEGRGGDRRKDRPQAGARPPGGDADQQDKRVDGQQIAGEQGSAEDGEGEPVGEDEEGDGASDRRGQGPRCRAQGPGPRVQSAL